MKSAHEGLTLGIAVGLALLALLMALVVGLLVAPHAHTDSDDGFYSAAQSSVLTVKLLL